MAAEEALCINVMQSASSCLKVRSCVLQLFSSLCKALRDSRSQAQAFSMVPADESCMTYMPELQALLGPALQQPCFNITDPG